MSAFTESTVESAVIAWLKASGWKVAHGFVHGRDDVHRPDVLSDHPESARWSDR